MAGTLWHHAPFRWLWLARLVLTFADQFLNIALPWFVLQATGSSVALGTVLAVRAVPRGALMLIAGPTADRWSPKLAILGSLAARLTLVAALAIMVTLTWTLATSQLPALWHRAGQHDRRPGSGGSDHRLARRRRR